LNDTVNHVKNELMPEVDFTQFEDEREESQEVSDANSDLKWD
jgi:hypothetical protein